MQCAFVERFFALSNAWCPGGMIGNRRRTRSPQQVAVSARNHPVGSAFRQRYAAETGHFNSLLGNFGLL